MCAFAEPEEYLPAGRWFEQFAGKSSASALRVGRDVAAVTGCTLTSQAVARAVKRTLALSALLSSGAVGGR
jgi:Na+-translocating ferredoxin:NAD+ oxidoreductase RnfG subunit